MAISTANVSMLVTNVSTLFWWFLLILDEFLYVTSCIEKIISLAFCTYVERSKRSSDGI
jgi:hypothetical protein